MEMKEDHILVYFDDHFKGYEFFYKDVKNNRAVVSKLVYDDEDETVMLATILTMVKKIDQS